MMNREQILGLPDLPQVEIEVPEWIDPETSEPTIVNVRALTAGEVEEFGRKVNAGTALSFLAELAVKVVVDVLGQRVFRDDDVDALAGKNPKALQRISEAAYDLSGMGEDHAGN